MSIRAKKEVGPWEHRKTDLTPVPTSTWEE